jgi:glycosyltransferase involved in cell wall biosynthesis
MNIWLIQTGEPLPLNSSVKKMRTALLAEELQKRGHSVLWWTSAFDHVSKKWIFNTEEIQHVNGFSFFPLIGRGYKKNISPARFIDHRIVSRKFTKYANKQKKPDIVFTSLPPHDIAYKSVKFSVDNNIPVIIDIRDPWPDIFLDHLPDFLKPISKLILFNDFRMIKTAISSSTGVTAVTQDFMSWGLKHARRNQKATDSVFSIGYKKTGIEDISDVNKEFIQLAEKLKRKFIIFFVGTFSKSYHNPSILIKAAEELANNPEIHFVIGGNGELFSEIKSLSAHLSNVTLTGWLNQHEIEFWLNKASVGLCPATKPVNLPTNKAYAYLSAGLPVISAFEGELKEYIKTRKIGIHYEPENLQELTSAINKLYSDADLCKTYSGNASVLFNEKYNADNIYKEFADFIENFKVK